MSSEEGKMELLQTPLMKRVRVEAAQRVRELSEFSPSQQVLVATIEQNLLLAQLIGVMEQQFVPVIVADTDVEILEKVGQ